MYLDENRIVYSLGPSRLGETCFTDIVVDVLKDSIQLSIHEGVSTT